MATPTFTYPTSAELTRIDPLLLATEVRSDPLLGPGGLMPIKTSDADQVIWEQEDYVLGMMQWRGLGNDPPKVDRLGSHRYRMQPGYYGEFNMVDEEEMTRRAAPATWYVPIAVGDLVAGCQQQLLRRMLTRMRWICWQFIAFGRYIVNGEGNTIVHEDGYTQQVFTPTNLWSDAAQSAPLDDLRQIPILGRGQSTNFGAGAELWVTQQGANYILNNKNNNDLFGIKLDYGKTVYTLADVNEILTRNALPNIMVYEDGYYGNDGVYHTFLPDNKGILIGRRTNGAPLGAFYVTRNLTAPNGRGVYVKVVMHGMAQDEPPPPKIEVHRGFHGGPALMYPKSIFVLNIA